VAAQRESLKRTPGWAEQSVLSSPTWAEILANTGMFRAFRGKNRGYSLQSRLRGGDGWIRTLGTGLNGARPDVCVGYWESILSLETEGRVVLRHQGEPLRFPIESKSEWAGDSLAKIGL
jgi:hypothetical protein